MPATVEIWVLRSTKQDSGKIEVYRYKRDGGKLWPCGADEKHVTSNNLSLQLRNHGGIARSVQVKRRSAHITIQQTYGRGALWETRVFVSTLVRNTSIICVQVRIVALLQYSVQRELQENKNSMHYFQTIQ